MAFNLLASRQKKRPSPFTADPSQLKTTTVQRQPNFAFDYQSLPGGATQIRRQTQAQANRPLAPTFTPGPKFPDDALTPTDTGRGPRMFQTARIGPGANVTGPQFPWQMRRGITSDVSRQGAFQAGFGSGKGRVGFARRATDTFFDPRLMFSPNWQRWAFQKMQRRRYGV